MSHRIPYKYCPSMKLIETYVRYIITSPNDVDITVRNINGDILDNVSPFSKNPVTEVLVIEMINMFSYDLLPVMIRDRTFLAQFKKVLVFNAHECPAKLLSQCPKESAMLQPVYEFLMTYYREFKPQVLHYYDHDIDTDKSFLIWCRHMKIKQAPFRARFVQRMHLANLLFSFVAEENKINRSKFKEEWKDYIKDRQQDKLYWSFNRHKRWGRVLIFYLLWKNNLLDDGNVSMHIKYLNRRSIDVLGIDIPIKDFDDINAILPRSVDTIQTATVKSKYLPTMVPDEILGIPVAVATETNFFEKNLAFTEKLLKPILCKQVILPVAVHNICHTLTDYYGLQFNSSAYIIDSIEDPIQRANKVIEILQTFKNNKSALQNEVDEVEKYFDKNLDILCEYIDDGENNLIKKLIGRMYE